VKLREAGSKRIVTSKDGIVWILPQEEPEDIAWRKEQRRQELLKRWDAPHLGPPGKMASRRGKSGEEKEFKGNKS